MNKCIGLSVVIGCLVSNLWADKIPSFRAETIDDGVQIGYGTAIGDVDGDGKPDILLADKKQFVWYRNPDWKKFVMAENLTEKDNVCIAARDIDGDGKVEVAVGAQWNPGDTLHSGSVHYLIPPEDRTQKWQPVELHKEPTTHRMRWVKSGEKEYVLVVAPLHGRGNVGGVGDGVKLLAYSVPANPHDEWKTTLLADTLHMTHNLDPCQWDVSSPSEEILYIGSEGGLVISKKGDAWVKWTLNKVRGGGEIRMFGESSVVTIEPLHGNSLVYYSDSGKTRVVLDDSFKEGHAIAVADLFGNGKNQIVAGWRSKNKDKKVGVKLYYQEGEDWKSMWIDDNTMATEDLRVGDLNGDGKPDIVAAGRATKNLKVYWNE